MNACSSDGKAPAMQFMISYPARPNLMQGVAPMVHRLAPFLVAATLIAQAGAPGAAANGAAAQSARLQECRRVVRFNHLSKIAREAFIADCLGADKAADSASTRPGLSQPAAGAPSGATVPSGRLTAAEGGAIEH